MASSLFISSKVTTKSQTPTLLRRPVLHLFSTTAPSPESDPSPSPPPKSESDPDPNPIRTSRPLRRDSPDLAATVTHMISARPWTTRLQNSIRSLVPNFSQPLVLSIISSSSPDRALNFFRWVEKTGFRHSQQTYSSIISTLARNSMLNHARCLILDDMPKRQIPRSDQMLADLILGYGKAGIPQESVKLFKSMPLLGVDRSFLSYDAFFKAILINGRVLMAKRAFNFMAKEGVAPALSTYNVLIWGFCLSGKMETAGRFFEDMKAKGFKPDVVTYNTMINGWVRAKRADDARKMFDEMGSVGLEPNLVSYNLMIKGLMGSGRVDDGLRLFGEMRAKEIRTTEQTYAALMPWLCDDAGRTADAKKVFDEMAERRITPKDKDKSVFLRLIASMFESGNLDGAVEVHKAMRKFRVRLDSCYYGLLIEGLCRGDKLLWSKPFDWGKEPWLELERRI